MNKPRIRYFSLILGLMATIGVVAPAQVVLNPLPARVLGQFNLPKSTAEMAAPPSVAPNLVEGREFNTPRALAFDRHLSPPAVYVVDSANNRVLGWRDATAFANGAMADIVLGQKDFRTTQARGNASFPSGLYAPSSVAVDGTGNVFVLDTGDNRVLRFPAPLADGAASPAVADLVIGQVSLSAYYGNQSATLTTAPTAASIKTCPGCNTSSGGSLVGTPSLAFDPKGNLWISDAGNHRVLRYDAADVSGASNLDAAGKVTNAIEAKTVLGHIDFVTATANPGRVDASKYPDRIDRSSFRYGGPLTFDSAGNLFFADDLGRVLVWKAATLSSGNGRAADGILGVWVPATLTALPAVNEYMFGAAFQGSSSAGYIWAGGPRGLFCAGDNLFVVDSYNHRVVGYDPLSTWQASTTAGLYATKMKTQFGQVDFNSAVPNAYPLVEPSASAYSSPLAGGFSGTEVFIVDAGNNRVIAQPYYSDSTTLGPATRVLGQVDFQFRQPNLIEGREFGRYDYVYYASASSGYTVPLGPKVALDRTVNPPRLYIADTLNNRILCYLNARTAQNGAQADLVIGQVDSYRALVNSPFNDPAGPTATGLHYPAAVLVDKDGNLWVADAGNGRVLRYPNPFTRTDGAMTPDLVLGAPTFEKASAAAAQRDSLGVPVSLALTSAGNLVVDDAGYHRVVLYKAPFTSGQAADIVLGQPDGVTSTAGKGEAQFSWPQGIAVDGEDRLYVADTLNKRIQMFRDVSNQSDGAVPGFSLELGLTSSAPMGVTVSPSTGKIWIADYGADAIVRYPTFNELALAAKPTYEYGFSSFGAAGVTLDEDASSILVNDGANRISVHYPMLTVVNGVSGFPLIAPAMIGQVTVPGLVLDANTDNAAGTPLPASLGDLALTVDGRSAPLLMASGNVLRFIVPKDSVTSGTASFLVTRASTGEILAYSPVTMTDYSPAVFYYAQNPPLFDSTGAGQQAPARALNQDGTQNSSGNPASAGQGVTIFLTGYGNVPGLPDDGKVPDGDVNVDAPQVYLLTTGGATVGGSLPVQSSKLDPTEPGVWQVKFTVPQVNASGNYRVVVLYKDRVSHQIKVSNGTSTSTLSVYPLLAVKR